MKSDDYNLSCTCPYGDHCKHEAAVLYCLKKVAIEIINSSIQSEFDNLSSLERFQKDLEKSIKALNYKYSDYDYYDEHDDEPKIIEEAEKDEYLTDRKIVDWLLDIYKDNIPKQIEIIEKYCHKANGWYLTSYYEKLLELCKKTDSKKYQIALLDYFYKSPSYVKYVEIKKTLTKEKWNKIKPEVLSKIKNNANLYCDICLEEKEYQNVFNALNKSSIDFISSYIDKIYPEELFKLSEKPLNNSTFFF